MKTVDQGSVVTTAALPKFNQAPTITSPNGVVVAVPVEVTVDANAKAKAAIEKSPAELGKIALELSKQPGYEYLATLDKNNEINWVQVDLIQKNWDYTQEGLTPGAAALIAIAITIAAGPAGSGLTASMVATNAAGIALQTQAVITLINNKGDISKTLKDMASSDTIRNMATAALTAGLTSKLNIPNMSTNEFANKLVNGVAEGATGEFVNAAVNGVSLEEALKNSLRNSLVDVFAAETFSSFVKNIDTDDFADNLAHKLVAAGVGCVTASAKQQSCDAGALGAAVGEMLGDYLVNDPNNLTIEQKKEIMDTAKLLAGSVALLTNVDVNTAANSASIAVENNALKAVVTTVKVAGKLIKIAYKKGGKINVSDLKKTLKDEELDIVDNLITLNDGLINIHDAQAIIDLVVGTNFNSANKGQAAKEISSILSNRNSSLPFPNKLRAKNGLSYQSNSKHTPGPNNGSRKNAGIEPTDSFQLFENSFQSKTTRYAVDSKGNINQFFYNNFDSWHWAGRTGKDQPVAQRIAGGTIPPDVIKHFSLNAKNVSRL